MMMMVINRAWDVMHGMKVGFMMVLVQVVYAGVNVFYKLASLDGMDLRILIAYRFLFAVAFISPLAFFLERKTRPKLTWTVLGQSFLCGLFGGSLVQNLYLESLSLTSATFASSMTNLIPAITFVLAVVFRLEKLSLRRRSGMAKVAGTLLGIGGAMLLTFYKGVVINLWNTNIHLMNSNHQYHHHGPAPPPQDGNRIVGALTSLGSSLSYASWLILQAKMCQIYPSHYSSTALMCIMGAIQALIFALLVNHNWEDWKLGWNIRLLTVAYTGVIGSGAIIALLAWCVQLKGPLYVSVFNPLMLILVAIAGSLVLDEKLYLGSVLGAILIICGLYFVLWGKAREMKKTKNLLPSRSSDDNNDPQGMVTLTSLNNDIDSDERNNEVENVINEAMAMASGGSYITTDIESLRVERGSRDDNEANRTNQSSSCAN